MDVNDSTRLKTASRRHQSPKCGSGIAEPPLKTKLMPRRQPAPCFSGSSFAKYVYSNKKNKRTNQMCKLNPSLLHYYTTSHHPTRPLSPEKNIPPKKGVPCGLHQPGYIVTILPTGFDSWRHLLIPPSRPPRFSAQHLFPITPLSSNLTR